MKKKNNSGFTLTELVVVMAVSSIFLGMVMVILASSLNLFNKNEKQHSSLTLLRAPDTSPAGSYHNLWAHGIETPHFCSAEISF